MSFSFICNPISKSDNSLSALHCKCVILGSEETTNIELIRFQYSTSITDLSCFGSMRASFIQQIKNVSLVISLTTARTLSRETNPYSLLYEIKSTSIGAFCHLNRRRFRNTSFCPPVECSHQLFHIIVHHRTHFQVSFLLLLYLVNLLQTKVM